jgi:enoyl-CoA hydratase
MSTVSYRVAHRVGYLTLNRPDAMNAIDGRLPEDLAAAVARANADPDVRVIVLSGAGRGFCAGYDLDAYAATSGANAASQDMPWDPMKDYAFMMGNTQAFMSLWRSHKPTIAKVHGYALAGGSDIAMCCDLIVMANDARIGYMPARVWGCPTTAMWVYRIGAERAKRMLFTGDMIDGEAAARIGLAHLAVPEAELDAAVDGLAARIASVPSNQLMMQKLMINHAVEAMGLGATQMLATLFDGVARHSPEGMAFKRRAEEKGWKTAVRERDQATYDWSKDAPFAGGA